MYSDYLEHFQRLSNEDAGILIKAILRYVSGLVPGEMPPVADMAFSFIRNQLDRDIKTYEDKCKKNRENGKLGGRPKKANGFSKKRMDKEKANGFSEKHNDTDNDSDTDIDIDNDSDTDIDNDFDTDIDNDSDTDIDNDINNINTSVGIVDGNDFVNSKENSSGFEEFWRTYPKKMDKGAAFKKYNDRLQEGYTDAQLITAARNYRAECERKNTDDKYIKYPKTFLSDTKPFMDYLEHDTQNRQNTAYTQYTPYASEPVRKFEDGENPFARALEERRRNEI